MWVPNSHGTPRSVRTTSRLALNRAPYPLTKICTSRSRSTPMSSITISDSIKWNVTYWIPNPSTWIFWVSVLINPKISCRNSSLKLLYAHPNPRRSQSRIPPPNPGRSRRQSTPSYHNSRITLRVRIMPKWHPTAKLSMRSYTNLSPWRLMLKPPPSRTSSMRELCSSPCQMDKQYSIICRVRVYLLYPKTLISVLRRRKTTSKSFPSRIGWRAHKGSPYLGPWSPMIPQSSSMELTLLMCQEKAPKNTNLPSMASGKPKIKQPFTSRTLKRMSSSSTKL